MTQAPTTPIVPTGEADLLLRGERSACVWGLGHIGAETVRRLAEAGVRVLGYDVDPARARVVASANGCRATTDRDEALHPDVLAHFIAVPTERAGRPYNDAVVEVVRSIAASTVERADRHVMVVVESTLTPGTTDEVLLPACQACGAVVGRDVFLVVAPRRDWLLTPAQRVGNVGRVYGGTDARSASAGEAILALVEDQLHRASNHRVAELVKCAENAMRHVQIMLGNQLSLAYPDVNVAEVLELAATKWNVEMVHPSFGTGGYCVPLSSRYLLEGARDASALSVLDAALATESHLRQVVAERVQDRKRVAVLGLAYRAGVKVATLSPTISLAAQLRAHGTPYSVHDPYYSAEEISSLCPGADTTNLEDGIRSADTVLIVTDHQEFVERRVRRALAAPIEGGRLVLDSPGVLAGSAWPSWVEYYRAGDAGWLGRVPEPLNG